MELVRAFALSEPQLTFTGRAKHESVAAGDWDLERQSPFLSDCRGGRSGADVGPVGS